MAVMYGLDTKEITWSKLRFQSIWNKAYHMRRTKMIVYPLTIFCCILAQTAVMPAIKEYSAQKEYIEKHSQASVSISDYFGVSVANILIHLFVVNVFGTAFFVELMWPDRTESNAARRGWKICTVIACLVSLADAVAYMVIVITQGMHISGIDSSTANRLLNESNGPPREYKKNTLALVCLGLLWLAFIRVFGSTIVVFLSQGHNEKFGPMSSQTQKSADDSVGMRSLRSGGSDAAMLA